MLMHKYQQKSITIMDFPSIYRRVKQGSLKNFHNRSRKKNCTPENIKLNNQAPVHQ